MPQAGPTFGADHVYSQKRTQGHGTAVARQRNGTRQFNQALKQARERPGLTGTVPERQRGGSDSAAGTAVMVAGSGDCAGPGLGYGR